MGDWVPEARSAKLNRLRLAVEPECLKNPANHRQDRSQVEEVCEARTLRRLASKCAH
jgi:hypothetical protein